MESRVSLRRETERTDSASFFATLWDLVPMAVVVTDVDAGVVVHANRQATNLFRVQVDTASGMLTEQFWLRPLDRAAFLQNLIEAEGCTTYQAELRTRCGTTFWAQLNSQMMPWGGQRFAVTTVVDATTTRSEIHALKALCATDPLTGLLNRRGAQDRLNEIREAGGTLAIALVDVDHFKSLNDRLGHPVGDEILQHLAQRLRGSWRSADVVARYGGDEFIVAAHDLTPAGLRQRLEAISAGATIDVADPSVPPLVVTLSIGIATLAPGETLQASIERADQALYEAKRKGRAQVAISSAA